jgi:FKBP-type peptidyl-prolyl cis-trans isomerase
MKQITFLFFALFFASCNTDGVKSSKKPTKKVSKVNILDQEHKIIDKLKREDGISISWFEKGTGEKLQDGDLVQIDYKVKLSNGTVVDGNHLLKSEKSSLPFVIGFNMQTIGWDLAFKELRVGDFVKIILPSKLARGENGLKDRNSKVLIPPNADNLLLVRILKKETPTKLVDGTKVWLLEENKTEKLKFNEKTQITFHGIASSQSTQFFVNTFRSNQPFSYKLSDYGLVPGLRKALINAKKSDKLYIVVPPAEAYGSKGYLDFVRPNESLFYSILVMDVTKI